MEYVHYVLDLLSVLTTDSPPFPPNTHTQENASVCNASFSSKCGITIITAGVQCSPFCTSQGGGWGWGWGREQWGDILKWERHFPLVPPLTALTPRIQAESIQRREELLQEMESVSQLTARQSKLKEEERIKRAEELREQVIYL